MMVCRMAQALPPPDFIAFVDIYLVGQDAARFSKGARAIILALHELLSGSVPVFFAQHFGFQQRGEAVSLEELIAREAVEALAMEVPTGRNVKESQNRAP
jgi:hypothetical protein